MTTESDAGIREGLPMPVHDIAEPRLRPGPDSLVWKFHGDIRNLVGTLPRELREVCELPWSARSERRFQSFAAIVRAANPLFNRLPVRALGGAGVGAHRSRSTPPPQRKAVT
ncbi:oxygenase MpaB family protein [Nocardia testacea]|uniref:oxygenase MpaB family protein n=1 Tax=Nocardia testacea TaxID=248551 RepID=UPI003F4CBBC4